MDFGNLANSMRGRVLDFGNSPRIIARAHRGVGHFSTNYARGHHGVFEN